MGESAWPWGPPTETKVAGSLWGFLKQNALGVVTGADHADRAVRAEENKWPPMNADKRR